MRMWPTCSLLGLMCVWCLAAWGQPFEFVDPAGQVTAIAEITRHRLVVIDSNGERLEYTREFRYDSTNGQYVGFFNAATNRVLRFPRSGVGRMYAADLNEAVPQFRQTIRTVRPRSNNDPNVGTTPPDLRATLPTIAVPGYVSPGYVSPGYAPSLAAGIARSQSVLIDSELVPNDPLPPVTVNLVNSGTRDLQVELVGLAQSIANQSLRLAPGERRPVIVQRDAGGQRIDYYQVISPLGETFTKQVSTPVPAEPLYEVVVHQWTMQSIAIDRTGKSPNAIEDVNYQGQGIGRFPLPAGSNLTSTTIDVLRVARAIGNPGAVAPLVPANSLDDRPSDEPLDRALRDVIEQQRRATPTVR